MWNKTGVNRQREKGRIPMFLTAVWVRGDSLGIQGVWHGHFACRAPAQWSDNAKALRTTARVTKSMKPIIVLNVIAWQNWKSRTNSGFFSKMATAPQKRWRSLGCPVWKKYKNSQKNLDTQQHSIFSGKQNVLINLALSLPSCFSFSLSL